MTSETETLKTNEFLRRRKLRLQQVREQSKDIAKKIRQRAKVETLRQVDNLDAKKQKEYFDRQEKLVKRLEVLYARGLDNVGASHHSASEVTQQDQETKKDLSKVRGKEAAAELRKKRQDILDKQKKLLDRKLQAREAANELSREKTVAPNKVTNPVQSKVPDDNTQKADPAPDNSKGEECGTAAKNDMATQSDVEAVSNPSEPAVPALALPKDDSVKEDEHVETKSDKTKRLDLFALSKEMPTDLCGRPVEVAERRDTVRPSLTMVSEYLQTRKLRLRETDQGNPSKKQDDMSSLKQTILRTRTSRVEGIPHDICHVVDEQVIPVPSWHAERTCEFCTNKVTHNKSSVHAMQLNTVTNSQNNRIFSSIRPLMHSEVGPRPVLRSTSPFRRNKMCPNCCKSSNCTAHSKPDHILNKKSSVTMYNHYTRDIRDLPCSDEHLVVRDAQTEEDAYAQALKEASIVHGKDKEHEKKVQDMRNKVAVTKQTVEKEYKDTLNFLNSLPKEKGSKVTKTAYMDERRQQMQNEKRQHKLQQEYRQIEKECRRHHSCTNKSRSKSRSPSKQRADDDFDKRDFQYSWMPVPEGDGNLAIHTIPNSVKEGKTSSVKFSKVDSYHEYRSRHKHTPPTKDTATHEKHPSKKRVETIIIDKNISESSEDISTASDTSSVENLRLHGKERNKTQEKRPDQDTSDMERIIIYKVLDSKSDKQTRKKNKLLSDIAKSLTSIEKVQKSVVEDNNGEPVKSAVVRQRAKDNVPATKSTNSVSFEHVNEGIYKVAEEDGENMMHLPNDHLGSDYIPTLVEENQTQHEKLSGDKRTDKRIMPEWECGHFPQPTRTTKPCHCSTTCTENCRSSTVGTQNDTRTSAKQPSTTASAASFKTANNDKRSTALPDKGYIKLLDEEGHEAGKFFLGDNGLFKDNAYEVVLQLRKKYSGDEDKIRDNTESLEETIKPNAERQTRETAGAEEVETVNLVLPVTEAIVHPVPELDEILATKNSAKESKKISPRNLKQSVPFIAESASENTRVDHYIDADVPCNTNNMRPIRGSEELKHFTEKRTTTVQTDFPVTVSKFDLPSRPATTTYTQTTDSPTHRPVYIHMSSSTSTAYMSPPDIILPKFMRHDSGLTDFETCDMQSTDNAKRPYNHGQNRKKCKHVKRTSSKVNTECRINSQQPTPPNSVRSYCNSHTHKRTCSKSSKHDKTTNCTCRICAIPSKEHMRKPCNRIKSTPVDSCLSSQNSNLFIGKNATAKNKYKASNPNVNKFGGARLNPTVKGYINKLLALNKEGLKALEVADQECSSVGTPGSSIINVPCNIDETKSSLANKISLEHIKKAFMRQIINENINNNFKDLKFPVVYNIASKNNLPRKPRRKPVHKVKSLNISKHLLKKHKNEELKPMNPISVSTTTDETNKTFASSVDSRSRPRSSPSSRRAPSAKSISNSEKYTTNKASKNNINKASHTDSHFKATIDKQTRPARRDYMSQRATTTDTSPETGSTKECHGYYENKVDNPISMSTQTSQNIDSDFMRLAEDKLHNMEKIADLTEKCTKRLSNLAKVLEEVRKNKSLVYSQISASDSTDSHSDQKSDKVVKTPVPIDLGDVPNTFEVHSPKTNPEKEDTCSTVIEKGKSQTQYMSFLADVPKPAVHQLSATNISDQMQTNFCNLIPPTSVTSVNTDTNTFEQTKFRQKPPPALTRIHLKHGQEHIIPHELSTVIEVDSPMSIKNKTHSSRNDIPTSSNRSSNDDKEPVTDNKSNESEKRNYIVNPDLLQSNSEATKHRSNESSDDSKFQMIDMKHFNEIMLEPFISIHEYAKKYNIGPLDEESNVEELKKDDAINDDISSLHSDGSLPDVIAELLKRNIIAEPFKFDTASNINSTTISSESTLSMLALSRARKGKKRANVLFKNKENIGETSDTLSISSNPDLENAFKKLGMGWASSTLKKTKERLALSSSSNTSSSSMSHLKIKTINQDIPALVTDSVSSVLLSKKGLDNSKTPNNTKNAKQQTSFTKSMTVNEFLTNELANKITFTTNKSGINDTEDEFVSLFETKMPEGMQQQSQLNRDDQSNDSVPSGVNRARTSTPVQLFKSMTYHSSSGSNASNGLFSNVDDLSSVKMTSNSMKNNSTSDKDELTIPNFSLKMKKGIDSKSD